MPTRQAIADREYRRRIREAKYGVQRGVSRYNPERIAGTVPSSAGNVGPNYYERIAAGDYGRDLPQGADWRRVHKARNEQIRATQASSAERRIEALRARPAGGAGEGFQFGGTGAGYVVGGPAALGQAAPAATPGTPEYEYQATQAKLAGGDALRAYENAQVARAAGLAGLEATPGAGAGAPIAAPTGTSLLAGGQVFPDTDIYYNPAQFAKEHPAEYKDYKRRVRESESNMMQSLARMPGEIQTAEQARSWLVNSPYYDPSIGAALHAALERHLDRTGSPVLNRLREQSKLTEQKRILEQRAAEAGGEYIVGLNPQGEWAIMPSEMTPLRMRQEKQQLAIGKNLERLSKDMEKDRQDLESTTITPEEYNRRWARKEPLYQRYSDEIQRLDKAMYGESEEEIVPREDQVALERAAEVGRAALQQPGLTDVERQALQAEMNNLFAPAAPAAPAGEGTMTMGGRTETYPSPVAAPVPSPTAVPPTLPPAGTEVVSSEKSTMEAELRKQFQEESYSNLDILKSIGEDIDLGLLKAGDIMNMAAAKVGETAIDLLKLPLTIAAWEAKLGKTAFKKLMTAAKDRMIEKRVQAALLKE